MKLVEIGKKGSEVFSFDSVQNEAPKEARIAKKSIRKENMLINRPLIIQTIKKGVMIGTLVTLITGVGQL